MRLRSTVLLAAALFALPAAASTVDPASLVVQRADIAAGYRLVRSDSGHLRDRNEARSDPELARFATRNGRTDGYVAAYENGAGGRVISRADLYRQRRGAHNVLQYADLGMRKVGIRGLRRSPVAIASEGWIYSGGSGDSAVALVAWRHGRVFASVTTAALSRKATLTIANEQEHRIAAVVR